MSQGESAVTDPQVSAADQAEAAQAPDGVREPAEDEPDEVSAAEAEPDEVSEAASSSRINSRNRLSAKLSNFSTSSKKAGNHCFTSTIS